MRAGADDAVIEQAVIEPMLLSRTPLSSMVLSSTPLHGRLLLGMPKSSTLPSATPLLSTDCLLRRRRDGVVTGGHDARWTGWLAATRWARMGMGGRA